MGRGTGPLLTPVRLTIQGPGPGAQPAGEGVNREGVGEGCQSEHFERTFG